MANGPFKHDEFFIATFQEGLMISFLHLVGLNPGTSSTIHPGWMWFGVSQKFGTQLDPMVSHHSNQIAEQTRMYDDYI